MVSPCECHERRRRVLVSQDEIVAAGDTASMIICSVTAHRRTLVYSHILRNLDE
jgi:hypothetical protein